MNTNLFKLEKILDLDKWQNLQDTLAEVIQLAIITTDYRGVPITKHSSCSSFCQTVRMDPELSKRCQQCDSRGGLEAVRTSKPYTYLCHYNIVDVAIPIAIDDKYVGAIMAGQIRINPDTKPHDLEQILHSQSSIQHLAQNPDLQKLYNQIPVLPYFKVQMISQMLFDLCNYIVDEAKNKNYFYEKCEYFNKLNNLLSSAGGINNEELIQLSQNDDNFTVIDNSTYATSSKCNPFNVTNEALTPIFRYVSDVKNKTLSLTEAAELCHLSPSYFSRLFSKEIKQSYTTYITNLKIHRAKQLLEETNLSITQISDNLDFNDPGYFIRTFKKQEGITPSIYRKYLS